MRTIDALVDTVERLWPQAGAVDVSRRGRGRAAAPGPSTDHSSSDRVELAVVPNAASARLLAPVDPRSCASAVQRFSAAISVQEMLQRRVVGTVTRVAGAALLRDRVVISSPGTDNIATVVADVVGGPVALSLGIGTVRANRKPVLGAFDPAGRPVAFVKVGDNPASIGHVRREAEALEALGERDWRVIEVPRLLGAVEWRDMYVLVMSALVPPPWQGRDGRWPMPDAAMDELAFIDGVDERPLAATPMWGRLSAVPGQLADQDLAAELADALERVERSVGDTTVQVGAWHGDFTPWNMARSADRLQLWDWERFELGVPRGLDRIHYAVHTLARERGFSLGSVVDGLRLGATGDGRRDLALAATYLAALGSRYLLGAQGAGGEAVADQARLVLSILTELSRHLGDRPPETSP
jgi:hypothetical protein